LFEQGNKVAVQDTFPHLPLPIDSQSRPFLFLETHHPVKFPGKIKIYFEDGLTEVVPVALGQEMPLVENILLKFWAKRKIEIFEDIYSDSYENDESRDIRQLAEDLQIQSKFTRWIAVQERDDRLKEIAHVQVVPVDFPYMWEHNYDRIAMSASVFSLPLAKKLTFTSKRTESTLLHFLADSFGDEDIFDIFIHQKVDGHIELPGSHATPYLDTLVVLLWLFHKIEKEKEEIRGYESNLKKAINFLNKHISNFGHGESLLWNFMLWKFEEEIEKFYPGFPIQEAMEESISPEKLSQLESGLKKLFSVKSLPEGKKLNKFVNKLLKLVKAS